MRVYIALQTGKGEEGGTLEMNYCLTFRVRVKGDELAAIQSSATKAAKKKDTFPCIKNRITLGLKIKIIFLMSLRCKTNEINFELSFSMRILILWKESLYYSCWKSLFIIRVERVSLLFLLKEPLYYSCRKGLFIILVERASSSFVLKWSLFAGNITSNLVFHLSFVT